jgi:hypothetical protein
MSRFTCSKVVAVLGVAALVYATHLALKAQAQATIAGTPAPTGATAATGPSLMFKDINSGGRPFFTQFSRSKVPGGWLIAAISTTDRGCHGLTFFPDPEHKWDGSSLP